MIPTSARSAFARRHIDAARAAGHANLDEFAGKAVLATYGLATPRASIAGDAAEARRAAGRMTGPFAVKVMSPDIIHKTDAGGVALGLDGPDAVAAAVERMAAEPRIAAASVTGWLVEEMAGAGVELVIGGIRDARFGPMLMVGLGGIFVEVLEDVVFRLCPIDAAQAHEMLDALAGRALLEGVRGRPAVDRERLVEYLLAVGGKAGLLVELADEIEEIDVNPIIASPGGAVAVDARIVLREQSGQVSQDGPPDALASPDRAGHAAADVLARFSPLFEPRTVAVLGASTRDVSIANTFIRRMKDFGYPGKLYPIHPKAGTVEDLKAYPSLADTPEPVDYAYVAIGAGRIPDALADARGRCRFAQVISSGFGEVETGQALEETLVRKAREGQVRVLGPNCLGTYSPRGGLTFPVGAPKEVGHIGVVSQSGGLSTDIIKRGQWRGVRFSGLVTIGNSADVAPHELVEFYLHDPHTKAIGLYLEDIKDGRAFFELLRSEHATKPVVILRGGRSSLGRVAAVSHTGALAGDGRPWQALCMQTAAVEVTDVDAFIDSLLALQHLTPRRGRPTRTVTLFGNGGGTSVLGTDAFAELGLEVAPYEGAARELLEAMGLPPGTSVANPIDTPVRTLQERDGFVAREILDIVYEHARPDAVVMHLNLAAFVGRGTVDPVDNLFSVIEQVQRSRPGAAHFMLVLRSDGSPELDEKRRAYREKARAVDVPVYDEIPSAARALATVAHLERRL